MPTARLWMTTAIGAALATLAIGPPALAQVDLRVLRQQDEIRQQQEISRQSLLAAQREASAAQNRYNTQLTLRALDSAANPPTKPTLRPALPVVPPRGPDAADLAADAARIDALTDQRLAESNARLRAITPAY
ncbi:hypothetical protein ASD79_12015 [Caulobacter sp. Root655]|uniref:hypothetical protein n=1 Tax=Caulobacter sp. Root655 TaxID=1736578 RepID=UPI0006F3552A|nr:hypothetical protein [Caulobacter sp. Root655]KRA59673.1 hypothetical protein ASD79_12015 [Caulobacter sp. Root655]